MRFLVLSALLVACGGDKGDSADTGAATTATGGTATGGTGTGGGTATGGGTGTGTGGTGSGTGTGTGGTGTGTGGTGTGGTGTGTGGTGTGTGGTGTGTGGTGTTTGGTGTGTGTTTTPPPVPCDGVPTGTDVGACAEDFVVRDADGAVHSLYDHFGQPVVLDLTAMWCITCQNAADDTEALHRAYAADGVVVMTVIYNDVDFGDMPTGDDLDAWSDAFGLTHPVYADSGEAVWDQYGGGGRPAFVVFDRDLNVHWRGEGGAAVDAVEGALLEVL